MAMYRIVNSTKWDIFFGIAGAPGSGVGTNVWLGRQDCVCASFQPKDQFVAYAVRMEWLSCPCGDQLVPTVPNVVEAVAILTAPPGNCVIEVKSGTIEIVRDADYKGPAKQETGPRVRVTEALEKLKAAGTN
jgi:hypothetical protein